MYVEGGENVGEREGWPPVWCGETGNLAIYSFQGGRDIDNLPVGHQLTVTVETEKAEVSSHSVPKVVKLHSMKNQRVYCHVFHVLIVLVRYFFFHSFNLLK